MKENAASEMHTRVPRATEKMAAATPVGFEPTRGDPIGLAGRRLNRSAKVSLKGRHLKTGSQVYLRMTGQMCCMEALDQ